MGLLDYMGAFTDPGKRISSSKPRSRTSSWISDLKHSNKRHKTIQHQGLGLGLGSVVHFSPENGRNSVNSVVRRLDLIPAPSPLKREVQGPQRPSMPKPSPQRPVCSTNKRIDGVFGHGSESKPDLELDNEWTRPVRCYDSPVNFEELESYRKRVARLQSAFAYAQRGYGNKPSSSEGFIVQREKERKEKEKEKPKYKILYEKANENHDFKLKGLELEIKLATAKFQALQFATKEIKSESQIQNHVEAEKEQQQYEEFKKKNLVGLRDVFTPLSDEEESDVARALRNPNRLEVLVMHDSSNIEITRQMFRCLLPNGWLNDEVINLYLELLKERQKREPDKFLKCHFFNTFFYKKLYSPKSNYDYKAVKRWTTQKKIGYSLTDCDKIFVPIHKEIHWCLAIIDMRAKKFQYLDSLKGTDGHVLQVLARYIADEANDKRGQDLDVSAWEQEVVEDIPEQENGWDCGMFMIKYADFHSRDLPLIFGQEHMPYFRKRTAKEILKLRAE